MIRFNSIGKKFPKLSGGHTGVNYVIFYIWRVYISIAY